MKQSNICMGLALVAGLVMPVVLVIAAMGFDLDVGWLVWGVLVGLPLGLYWQDCAQRLAWAGR